MAFVTHADAEAAIGEYSTGRGQLEINPMDPAYGVKADTKSITLSGTAGSAVVTSAGASFAIGRDEGKLVVLYGASATGEILTASIVTVTSTSQVTLSTTLGTTVSAATAYMGTDDTTAWETAWAAVVTTTVTGRGIRAPIGYSIYNGSGLSRMARFKFTGHGKNASHIILGTGKRFFAFSGGTVHSQYIADVTFVGGAGAYGHDYTGVNASNASQIIERVDFLDYTNFAYYSLSTNMPYTRFRDCRFRALNTVASIAVTLPGLPNTSLFDGCSFQHNRIRIKLVDGLDVHVRGCEFLRSPADTSNSSIDLWLVPDVDPTGGSVGMSVTETKFGNENLNANDFRVLVADEDAASGTDASNRFPLLSADSAGYIDGIQFVHNKFTGNATATAPMVYSTTPNITGLYIGPNEFSGTAVPYVLQYRTPPTSLTGSDDVRISVPNRGGRTGTQNGPPLSNATKPPWVDAPSQIVTRTTDNLLTVNSTTEVADAQLTLPLARGGIYILDAFLIYDGPVADMTLRIAVPTGATLDGVHDSLNSTVSTSSGSVVRLYRTGGGVGTLGCAGVGTKLVALPKGRIVVGSTAGNVTLSFAQAVADPGQSTVYAGSWLRLQRYA